MEDATTDFARAYRYDVFICYAYEDRKWVNLLVALLESSPYKLKCCIHERDFETGTSTLDNIGQKLASSKKFILVITSAFNSSNWCEYERDRILGLSIEEKERVVIPLLLEECSMPQTISHITYASVSWDFTEGWFDKITMALEVKEIVCSVCSDEGVRRNGYTRCPECKASFCTECNRQHSRMPISKSHKAAKVRGYSEVGDMDGSPEEWSELQNSQFKIKIQAKGRTPGVGQNDVSVQHTKKLKGIKRKLSELLEVVYSCDEDVSERSVEVDDLPIHKIIVAGAYHSNGGKRQVMLPESKTIKSERAEALVAPFVSENFIEEHY